MHVDAVGGLAGDMFVAALLDLLCMDVDDLLLTQLRSAGLASDVSIGVVDHHDGVLHGRRFVVDDPRERNVKGRLVRNAAAHHHHPHARIQRDIADSDMTAGAKQRASDIFHRLAAAEAHMHGIAVEDVAFHEVGAQDSIADVCAAAILLDRLAPAGVMLTASCGSLPTGSGMVHTAHGELPVPAPATLQLLQGLAMHDDGRAGERITPTGAAILTHLRPSTRRSGVAAGVGLGFGTRTLVGMSNVTRLSRFEVTAAAAASTSETSRETISCIRFDIDDQSSEDLAIGLERLRQQAGVVDVISQVGIGKKGRWMQCIQVLCRDDEVQHVVDCCFNETTTIGVRIEKLERVVLARTVDAASPDSPRRKTVRRPNGQVTTKVEAEELAGFDASRRTEMKRRWESS